jgi:hypothetical protein
MMSRLQWYLLTIVRVGLLFVLVFVVGKRVEAMQLSGWVLLLLGWFFTALFTLLLHSWCMTYKTYRAEVEKRQAAGEE